MHQFWYKAKLIIYGSSPCINNYSGFLVSTAELGMENKFISDKKPGTKSIILNIEYFQLRSRLSQPHVTKIKICKKRHMEYETIQYSWELASN